jgi:hypothetical protein
MMPRHYVEVVVMRGRDWVSRGFHKSGSGLPGDGFLITGKEHALPMTIEFARRRTELYRNAGHKARIIGPSDRVVLDWNDPLVEEQPLDRFNQHEVIEYRGLRIVHDRATGKYHHRWAWPIEGGPERSVTSDSPEGIVLRLQELGDDVPAYLAAVLDKIERPVQQPATPPPPPTAAVKVEVPRGYQLVSVGIRPGSICPF